MLAGWRKNQPANKINEIEKIEKILEKYYNIRYNNFHNK